MRRVREMEKDARKEREARVTRVCLVLRYRIRTVVVAELFLGYQ